MYRITPIPIPIRSRSDCHTPKCHDSSLCDFSRWVSVAYEYELSQMEEDGDEMPDELYAVLAPFLVAGWSATDHTESIHSTSMAHKRAAHNLHYDQHSCL